MTWAIGVPQLTYMHQVVGMIGFEYAKRVIMEPMFMVKSRGVFVVVCLMTWPMLVVMVAETICCHDVWRLDSPYWQWYMDTELSRKQHTLIHAALAIILVGIGTSYSPRLRHSFRVQLARMFIEPSGVLTIAMLLYTHDHRSEKVQATNPRVMTHPMLATIMSCQALIHFMSTAAHLASPAAGDGPADLAMPMRDGPPSLLVWRCADAFSLLLIAVYVYILCYFEYFGCRRDFFGEVGDRRRGGYSRDGEVSTYFASTLIITALIFIVMVFLRIPELAERKKTVSGKVDYSPIGVEEPEPKLIGCPDKILDNRAKV